MTDEVFKIIVTINVEYEVEASNYKGLIDMDFDDEEERNFKIANAERKSIESNPQQIIDLIRDGYGYYDLEFEVEIA